MPKPLQLLDLRSSSERLLHASKQVHRLGSMLKQLNGPMRWQMALDADVSPRMAAS